MVRLGATDLEITPLCLGTNIFGWTTDEAETFAVLDAFVDAGGNFIDTADSYSAWVDGNSGGESESLIGAWMAARNNRSEVLLCTKVASLPTRLGLSPANIAAAVDDSLRRLRTDHIDLYYAHQDDPDTPIEETLGAFDALVHAGKVRWFAASNFTAPRLAESLAISRRDGLGEYAALQQHYNLLDRSDYEGDVAELCAREGLPCIAYAGLAQGFLTGKYRGDAQAATRRPTGADGSGYVDERGMSVLAVLDEVAAAHETTVAAVALAWLLAQPQVAAPIASARTPGQVAELMAATEIELTGDEIARLTAAGSHHAAAGW